MDTYLDRWKCQSCPKARSVCWELGITSPFFRISTVTSGGWNLLKRQMRVFALPNSPGSRVYTWTLGGAKGNMEERKWCQTIVNHSYSTLIQHAGEKHSSVFDEHENNRQGCSSYLTLSEHPWATIIETPNEQITIGIMLFVVSVEFHTLYSNEPFLRLLLFTRFFAHQPYQCKWTNSEISD